MANTHIEEFRSTVESVIQKQLDDTGGVSWPSMHTTAKMGHLTFGSYARGDMRPRTLFVPDRHGGRPERTWGISFESLRRADGVQRLGVVAVVSTIDRPDSLVRQWCLGKGTGLRIIDTIREIDTPETLTAINYYIRAPHFSSEAVIGQIATLSAEELASLQERETELHQSGEEDRTTYQRGKWTPGCKPRSYRPH